MQALILAAGQGKRLAPLTDTMPKVMVPIAGQPLVERISRQLVANGLIDQIIVVGYMKEMVMNHLGDGHEWGARITYVEQKELGGTGHAIRTAAHLLTGDFFMIFGDTLLETEMIAKVKNTPIEGAIGCTQVDEPSRYGILSVDSAMLVTALIEKPKDPPSNLAIIGLYKLPHAILGPMQSIGYSVRGEIEMTDAVRILIDGGAKFKAVDITGVMDIGTYADWERANELVKAIA